MSRPTGFLPRLAALLASLVLVCGQTVALAASPALRTDLGSHETCCCLERPAATPPACCDAESGPEEELDADCGCQTTPTGPVESEPRHPVVIGSEETSRRLEREAACVHATPVVDRFDLAGDPPLPPDEDGVPRIPVTPEPRSAADRLAIQACFRL